MEGPRECRCVHELDPLGASPSPNPRCLYCNGTGKVWPSVVGEFVTREEVSESTRTGNRGFLVSIPDDLPSGPYRILCQPLKEGE